MVLVILAIMVPVLTGWIDKAKEKQLTITDKTITLARQSAMLDEYGMDGEVSVDDIEEYFETGVNKSGNNWSIIFDTDKQVSKVEYSNGTNLATYENGFWTTNEDTNATFNASVKSVTCAAGGTLGAAIP